MTAGPHQINDDIRETAILYSLGLLEPERAEEFSLHVDVCATCRTAVRAQDELSASISLTGRPITPPAHLRQRLLDSLKPKQYIVNRGKDSAWEPFGPAGIDMKPLVEDPSTGTRTFLLRMQPGAVLPPHRHKGSEHCYVVEGDVFDREHSLSAGDYELRLPGSKHAPVSTRNGAVILITAAHHDEHH